MKCLLVTDGLLFQPKGNVDSWFTRNTFVKFAQMLSEHFDRLTLFVPVRQASKMHQLSNYFEFGETAELKIEAGGDFESVAEFYKKAWRFSSFKYKRLIEVVGAHDVTLLRLPSMNAYFFSSSIVGSDKPFCTYVVGDQAAIVREGSKYTGALKMIANVAAGFHLYKLKKLISRSSASGFLGRDLYLKYSKYCANSHRMFTSLIRDEDVVFNDISEWPPNPLKLLFAGRLVSEKGVDTLIRAVAILRKTGINAKLTICGEGPEENSLKSLMAEMNLEESVEFLGFVRMHPDLDEYLLKSDIFVLPSLSEGVPKIILEAMAKGLPVVATTVGGVPELVQSNFNGYLIPPKDEHKLADIITRILTDRANINEIRLNANKFAKQHTAERQTEKLAQIIKGVVK